MISQPSRLFRRSPRSDRSLPFPDGSQIVG